MSWRQEAACREQVSGPDTDIWFSDDRLDQAAAKDVCRRCPVRTTCLADALEREGDVKPEKGRHGIWGGMTPDERYTAATGKRATPPEPPPPPPCGTENKYQWHRHREGSVTCEPCRDAHRAHNRRQTRLARGVA